VVDELMSATLTARKGHYLSLLQITPSIWCAHARPAVVYEQQLLLGEVVMIGGRRLRRGYLPQAQSQPLAFGLVAQPSAQGAKSPLLARSSKTGS
jgi:hypothetical protein